MITQEQLEKIVMEEVEFVQERFMSTKFRKAIEAYQDLQLKQQQLQKAFVGTKDPKKREKLKKELVKMHYAVKKAEVEFNKALHVEPVEFEESVNLEINESTGIVEASAKDKFGAPPMNKWWTGSKESLMSAVYHAQRQLPPSNKKAYNDNWKSIVQQLQKMYPAPANIYKKKLKESTKAYGDSLKQIARDKQLKMLTKKDKETLLKLADLMKKMKEGSINATDEQKKLFTEKAKGLWHNIRAKRARGEKPAPKGSKAHDDAVAAAKKINNEITIESKLNEKKDPLKIVGKTVLIGKKKRKVKVDSFDGTQYNVTDLSGAKNKMDWIGIGIMKDKVSGLQKIVKEDDDRTYDSYSYHGDNLVGGVTPADNFGDQYKGQMALMIVSVMNSIDRVFLVAPEKEFISKAGRMVKGNIKKAVADAKKNGYANIMIPKKVYDKFEDSGLGYKNLKKYGAGMLQTNSLKGVSEDKLFPKKDKKNEGNLSEAKTRNVGELKVGQKFVVDQEPAILSANRAYYKLSPQKFSDVVFQVYKINPKSIAVRAIKGGDKLPGSAAPSAGGPLVDKKGNTSSKEYPNGYTFAAQKAGVKLDKRYVFYLQPTMKGDGNVPVTLK